MHVAVIAVMSMPVSCVAVIRVMPVLMMGEIRPMISVVAMLLAGFAVRPVMRASVMRVAIGSMMPMPTASVTVWVMVMSVFVVSEIRPMMPMAPVSITCIAVAAMMRAPVTRVAVGSVMTMFVVSEVGAMMFVVPMFVASVAVAVMMSMPAMRIAWVPVMRWVMGVLIGPRGRWRRPLVRTMRRTLRRNRRHARALTMRRTDRAAWSLRGPHMSECLAQFAGFRLTDELHHILMQFVHLFHEQFVKLASFFRADDPLGDGPHLLKMRRQWSMRTTGRNRRSVFCRRTSVRRGRAAARITIVRLAVVAISIRARFITVITWPIVTRPVVSRLIVSVGELFGWLRSIRIGAPVVDGRTARAVEHRGHLQLQLQRLHLGLQAGDLKPQVSQFVGLQGRSVRTNVIDPGGFNLLPLLGIRGRIGPSRSAGTQACREHCHQNEPLHTMFPPTRKRACERGRPHDRRKSSPSSLLTPH